ncbi:MAG TPA: DUF4136 domain-containing protein [Burkholderiaceae bacterium]|nr:DUF4136 domain-containing protein [Burkholderiaceae bacterium]
MNVRARACFAWAVAGLLAACASPSTLQAEIASYGQWPTARAPGTYAFDRLPSQQAQVEAQQRLEDAAHQALLAAGFTAAPPGAAPDVLVQLGARVTRYEVPPWNDPWWWRGGYWGAGFGRFPGRPFMGPYPYWYGSYGYGTYAYYDRQVALMLRDGANGSPLYEARASSDAYSSSTATLTAMFRAALADFPKTGSVPHSVSVPLTP